MFEEQHVRPADARRALPGVAAVRVTTLGGLAIDQVGQRAGLLSGQRKCLALLAVLSAAGPRGVPRDKLMALLGPEADTEHARNALSQVIFRVRRTLGQKFVEGKDELALNRTEATSDVDEFQRALADDRLEDAVALYQGPFLDGFYLRDAEEFERWTSDVRSRLERAHLSTLDKLAEAASERGDVLAAVAWSRRRMDSDPLSSPAARRLVRALVASGDRDGALRFGLAYTARVRLDLDVAPDGEFTDLLRQIRVGRTRLQASPTRRAVLWTDDSELNPVSGASATAAHATELSSTLRVPEAHAPRMPRVRRLSATIVRGVMLAGVARERTISAISKLLQRSGVRLTAD
jgi:DNA-binding SARP family transcriptional activator